MSTDQNQTKGLIEELGLGNLPEDEKNDMIVKLAEALQNRITVRLMGSMSDTEKQKLDDLVAQGNDEEIGKYLTSVVPNIDNISRDEFEKFRNELLSENAEIKKMIDEAQKNSSSEADTPPPPPA